MRINKENPFIHHIVYFGHKCQQVQNKVKIFKCDTVLRSRQRVRHFFKSLSLNTNYAYKASHLSNTAYSFSVFSGVDIIYYSTASGVFPPNPACSGMCVIHLMKKSLFLSHLWKVFPRAIASILFSSSCRSPGISPMTRTIIKICTRRFLICCA